MSRLGRGGMAQLAEGGRGNLFLLVVLAGARAAALVLIASSIGETIGIAAAGSGDMRPALITGCAGVLMRAAASWLTTVLGARAASRAKLHWRSLLAERGLQDRSLGEGETTILATRGLDDLDPYYQTVLPTAISAAVIPIVLGLRILSLDWVSAIIIAVTVPLVPLFMALIGMYTREKSDAATGSLSRLADHLVELARGLPVLVGLDRVAEQAEALDAIQREYRERLQRTLRVAMLSALALELIGTLSVAVVAVSLGLRLLAGTASLSTALVVLILAPECFAALREVGSAFHASQEGMGALRRIRDLLAKPLRAVLISRSNGARIRISGLSVSYPGRSRPALTRISASIGVGESVAIGGASGSGKSTLLSALTDTLATDARTTGAVAIPGSMPVAYSPQSPAFFADTVRDELALYSDRLHADALLAELDLQDVAVRSPGEISPGEARRLSVARALARVDEGARLLVLDEPTAHLDAANAERVRAAIARRVGSVTLVLASHDPRMAALASRELRVDGRAVSTAGAGQETRPDLVQPPRRSETTRIEPAPGSVRGALASILRPEAARWSAAIVLGAIAAAMALALIAVSGWLIVRAAEGPAIMYLMVAIVGVRFFGIGRAAARYAERLASHSAVLATLDRLRLRLWAGIAAQGAGSRRLQGGATALDLLVTATGELRDALPRILTPFATAVLGISAVIVTVALLTPAAGLIVGCALAGTLAIACAVAAATGRSSERARVTEGARLTRQFSGLLGASDDLRSNGVSSRAAGIVRQEGLRRSRSESGIAAAAGLSGAIAVLGSGLLAVFSPALVSGAFGYPTASAAVVSLLALACLEPLAAGASAAQRIPALNALLRPLVPLLAPSRASRTEPAALGGSVHSIRIEDLDVTWPDQRRPVFEHANAWVTRPGWLIIEGESGAGKTTLVTALLGAIQPSRGRLLVNGSDLAGIDPTTWHRRIAWCPQEAHVFDSTIRGNLLLARPRTEPVTDEEMMRALREVGLDSLVGGMVAGLATRIGGAGHSLSGGERQRLAVARALLGDADVLVLDEPTAHLDSETASAMMADIRRATADKIVVLVSHRAEDLRPEDHRIVLSQGFGSRTDAPNTAAWVRRSMPSFANNAET